MPTASTIEERLEAVEAAVAEIKQRMTRPVPSGDWLQKLIGSFKDEPAFDEVLAYGRAMREMDRPPEEDGGT